MTTTQTIGLTVLPFADMRFLTTIDRFEDSLCIDASL
jgi:hypothetical protein